MRKYACKYCGHSVDSPYGMSCGSHEVDQCIFVLNEGPVQCVYCGATYDSVEDLCHCSCGASPTGNHVAAR